jgi:hypothetical protein
MSEEKARYKVSLFISKANLPFAFAAHPWFVVENAGSVSRWEVGFLVDQTSRNYLYKDFLPPYTGIGIFPYGKKYLWKGHCLASIEGDENSVAQRMADFILNSSKTYPYLNQYSFMGPNSNTYIQWVLNHFPEFKVSLPWNSFGKNYK